MFRLIHQSCAVPSHLLVCFDCAKGNFAQLFLVIWPVADAAYGLLDSVYIFDGTHALMILIEDEAYYVLFRHGR